MSTATLTLDPVDSAALEVRPRRIRRTMSPQHLLRIAMEDSDQWVVEMEYSDSKGKRTRRTISPVRFTASDRFLGLCLCREEPRQFHLARCSEFRLIPAGEVIMPVEMVELS
ncbi:hypothetical protein [Neorhodopirellula lusitana]|uniref:hypothetical protein n=1 Tax=Neorhodopirellula lusitana TaxID=445327 RepID=UPI00384EE1BF